MRPSAAISKKKKESVNSSRTKWKRSGSRNKIKVKSKNWQRTYYDNEYKPAYMAMLKDFIDKNQDNYIGAFALQNLSNFMNRKKWNLSLPNPAPLSKVGTSSGNWANGLPTWKDGRRTTFHRLYSGNRRWQKGFPLRLCRKRELCIGWLLGKLVRPLSCRDPDTGRSV